MQSGNIGNFKKLSQFKDIKDFNNHIEQWMIEFKNQFTKSELIALKRLIRFSAKIAGVCNAKIGTVVSATHENNSVGISRSTFKRMIVKAKDLGLLTTIETVRKNGSKSSNVYVFNRFCGQAEPSKVENMNPPQTINLFKTTNQNKVIRNTEVNNATVHEITEKLDGSFTSESVPTQFTDLVKCFFNNARQIEEYWKLVTISAKKNKVSYDLLDTAIQSFKALIRKVKWSNVTNTYGYFYGVLNKKFKALYLKDLFNNWWEASF